MKKLILILTITFALAGCSMLKPATAVPGAVNSFDSDTYLSLITAKAVIDQAKSDLSSGLFPASVVPNVKTALNGAVTAYNVADIAFQTYHASAVAGASTPAQTAAVTTSMGNLQTAVTAVTSAKAGK